MESAQVRFLHADGSQSWGAMIAAGESVMAIARRAGVNGIIAECGGNLSCATCHVYVDGDWLDRFPGPGALEEAMLECVLDRAGNSRLSCQLPMSAELDGLVVHLPARQI